MTLTDQKFVESHGKAQNYRPKRGWQLCCQWKYRSTSWEKLYSFNNFYPVQTSNYAISQGIEYEPVFNWWVRHTPKKRDRVISRVQKQKTRYLKKNHKFGIELPKTVSKDNELDKNNGNTLWADSISKEMKNANISFDIMPYGERVPNGYTQIFAT